MAKKNQKGFLISFEGMEGAGKTTQCQLLEKKLQAEGFETLIVREPGGVPISEKIREIVLSPEFKDIAVTTEVLLFQAARAQLFAQLVLPALDQGKVVIMDRTRDSSLVYQGMVRKIGVRWIERLNDYSTQHTVPYLTFLLDLSAKTGMERRRKMGKLDRIEQEGVALQEKVTKAYLKVAKADKSGRWVVLDAMESIETLHDTIWERVKKVVE
jgi:dTMP kinase